MVSQVKIAILLHQFRSSPSSSNRSSWETDSFGACAPKHLGTSVLNTLFGYTVRQTNSFCGVDVWWYSLRMNHERELPTKPPSHEPKTHKHEFSSERSRGASQRHDAIVPRLWSAIWLISPEFRYRKCSWKVTIFPIHKQMIPVSELLMG